MLKLQCTHDTLIHWSCLSKIGTIICWADFKLKIFQVIYIVPSSFNVSLVWFFNLFGVKVWILNLRKVQQVTIREFLWKCAGMESPDFFVINKVGNRAAVDTYTCDPMLFQFCRTTAILINFTQNSNLNKSV